MDRPTGKQVRDFMDRHGLTHDAMAKATGLGRATIARYRKHGTAGANQVLVRHLVTFMRRKDRQRGGK